MKKMLIAMVLLLIVAATTSCSHDEILPVPNPNSAWGVSLSNTQWRHYLDTVVVESGVEIGYSYNHLLTFSDDATGTLLRRVRVEIDGEPTDSIAESMPLTYCFSGLMGGFLFVSTYSLATEADTTLMIPFRHHDGVLVVDGNQVYTPVP